MRAAGDALRGRHPQLVVDPSMLRVPGPGVGILGRDAHVIRTRDVLEILKAPRIGFADGHGAHNA